MGGSSNLSLNVVLKAQDLASGNLRGFGSTLVNLAGDAGPLLKVFGAISLAAIAVGVATVQSAADFQQSMLKNAALAGLSQDQYTSMSNAILDLAPQVGKAPKELADSLYYVLSAGVPASKALEAVRYSAMLAASGMTTTSITANALTNVMKVFGVSSAQAANIITKAVSDGKMTMEQYANSIGKLSLTAKGYKVSIYETNAALDTLSNNGFPSAAQASNALSNYLSIVDGRTDTVAKRAHKLGIAFDEQKFKTMNLQQQVQYLTTAFKGHESQIQTVLGGSKNAAQAFQALSGDTKGYNKALDDMKNSSKGAGAAQDAFTTTQKGLNQQMAQAKAAVDALGIKIGTALLPIITKLVSFIAPAINSFMQWSDAVSKNEVAMAFLKGALIAFAGVTLGLIIPAFITWATTAGAAALATLALTWPILLIGVIAAAVIGGIILAFQHWGQIMDWISGKAEQTRIKVELEHSKMALIADEKTAEGAKKSIANEEKKRQGILEKLKNCHSESERRELMHQLKMVDAQIRGNHAKLQKAEEDKKAQLAKQKELHAEMLEAQKNFFQRWMDQMGGWISGSWDYLMKMVNNWVSSLGKLKDQGIAKLLEIGTSIADFFKSLPGKALQWGIDMIQGFINGVGNMLGNLGQMMGNVGNKIKSFLHFSKPDTGPLVDIDTWMPDMMDLMTKGIIAGNPKLSAAVQMTAKTITGAGSPPALVGSVPYGRPPMSSNSYSSYAGGNTHNGDIIIHAGSANAKEVAAEVQKILDRNLRRSGVANAMTSGGKSS